MLKKWGGQTAMRHEGRTANPRIVNLFSWDHVEKVGGGRQQRDTKGEK